MTSLAYDEFCSERENSFRAGSHPKDDFQEFLYDRAYLETADGWSWARLELEGVEGREIAITVGDVRDIGEYGDGPRYTYRRVMSYDAARRWYEEALAEGWE